MPIDKLKIGLDFGTTFCFCGFQQGNIVRSLVATTETYGVPSVLYDNGSQKLIGRLAAK